jgi:hypothetical protein
MGDYFRTTRESTLNNLNPALLATIRTHIEKYELGDIDTSALLCCETTSTKQKKGLFGGKAEIILTDVILTSQWLIWATGRENESPSVLSARLRDIQVQDYEKSEMYKLMQDTGLNISGLRTDAVDLGSTFIGLGSEPAAQKFRNLLKETLAKA